MTEEQNWRFGVAANIVKQHVDDEGIVRHGTKKFPGGTKVYIDGKYWTPESETITVIGRNRFGHYESERIPIRILENIRCRRIYRPAILKMMEMEGVIDGWDFWGERLRTENQQRLLQDS